MDKGTKAILAAMMLIFAGLTVMCIAFATMDGRAYAAQNALMESGMQTQGEAVRQKKLGRRNVELTYEAEGEAQTAAVTVSGREFKRIDGKGADRDGRAAVTVYYDPDHPANATAEAAVKSLRAMKNSYIVCGCIAGIVFLAQCAVLMMLLLPDKRSAAKSSGQADYDFTSATERRAQADASKPLPGALEGYAKEIVALFQKYPDMYEREPKLRAIGEKMNNNEKQLMVAYRSEYLAKQAGLGNDFSTRFLEYAWDGIGGWRA